MARFRVTQPSYINDRLEPEGAEVEIDLALMSPGENLEPADEAARREMEAKAGVVQAAAALRHSAGRPFGPDADQQKLEMRKEIEEQVRKEYEERAAREKEAADKAAAEAGKGAAAGRK